MITDIMVRLDTVERKGEDPRFYYVWHKRLFNILMLLLLGNLIIWPLVFTLILTKPSSKSYIQNSEGKTVQITPIDEPNYTNQAIEEWSENAVKNIYSIDFSKLENVDKHRDVLRQMRPYFSDDGWQVYQKIFEETVVPKVKSKQLQVTASVDKAKVGAAPTIINGVTVWEVKVPLMLTYMTASERKTSRTMVSLTVSRQISYTNPKGLFITKISET